MTTIKSLFDQSKDIYRTIEKVITYNASEENRLKAEISEYVVTESIEEQFEKLLTKMQAAMDAGGENEVGVWVSGFYGSGKSSFTKYLGMALDDKIQIDGVPFIQHLQNRFHKAQTKALLASTAKRFPAAVVLLDLASEMLAGATMEEVSTVLYYKVLQWAGYSRHLKVAALERRLQKDGRYEEFKQRILDETGVEWKEIQNDPLLIDSIIPGTAHAMYPEFFKTPTSFSTDASDFKVFENERVKEMIEIAREVTGKQYIVFIIDEVGQYVGARPNLILNLDGLSKNLKDIGEGKVWILATAQQTLTEDDPRAALNSPQLYKLKDRFPIQIDLESSDIREICYRRLLSKSLDGETLLGKLFDQHGQALRHHTKLEDARYYDSDFNRDTFVNLYPFLPAHFDILLHLLGALAKSTGGVGLRSAIKVIQDILIEGADGRSPVAEKPVGWIATTVTLYDVLERDIKRAFPSIYSAMGKVLIRFPDSTIHQEIAKTVAVLQMLGNIPVTLQNVASLMHPSITDLSHVEDVKQAVSELISDSKVPFGEREGSLCFFSEKLNDIEQERAQIPLRSVETRRTLNEALREVFSPLPSTRLNGQLVVTSGIKVQSGTIAASMAGEREVVQTVIEFVEPQDYETARTKAIEESRQRSSENTIYLLGKTVPEIDDKLVEIFRCREICQRYRNEPDQEIKEYCNGQSDRAAKIIIELQHILKRSIAKGSFIFRGQTTAVNTLDNEVLEAEKKYLAEVAGQVFHKYGEAPVRVETAVAEQFLRTGNLRSITSRIDPLGLVQVEGGRPCIKTDHRALISIKDYLDRNGTIEGKRLTDKFTDAPYGWSQDTLRYLVATLLVAGEIKLKVSGREVTVNGQQAIDALKTNNAFRNVGVALRDERLSNDVLVLASERLTELVGDVVVPLEDEISKTAAKHLPQFQAKHATLEGKLSLLGLAGSEKIRTLNRDIADIMLTDASDAPKRFGSEESPLYEVLKWVAEVERALSQGLEETASSLQDHSRDIKALPDSGIPGQLRNELAGEIEIIHQRLGREDFYKYNVDLNTMLTNIKSRTRDAVINMAEAQKKSILAAEQDLVRLVDWSELTQEEQSNVLAQLEELIIDVSEDLMGLKMLVAQDYITNNRLRELKERIEREGRQRRRKRIEEENPSGGSKFTKSLKLPAAITSTKRIDELIRQLQELREQLSLYKEIEITINVEE